MPEFDCAGCRQRISDEELFCPHCGAATVPQLSKKELSRMMWAQSRPKQPLIAGLVGFVVVPLVYAVGSVVGVVSWDELKKPTRLAAFLMGWGLLAGCAALVGFIYESRRRPRL